jgi:hypothetical protein
LFPIGTISLPKAIQFIKTTDVDIMDIDVKTSILEQGSKVQNKKRRYIAIDMS